MLYTVRRIVRHTKRNTYSLTDKEEEGYQGKTFRKKHYKKETNRNRKQNEMETDNWGLNEKKTVRKKQNKKEGV